MKKFHTPTVCKYIYSEQRRQYAYIPARTGYTLANEAVDNATWRTPIWSVNAGSVTNQSDRCVSVCPARRQSV